MAEGGELAQRIESLPACDPRGYFCTPVVNLIAHVEERG